jgi:hypothetical protein
MTVGIITEKGHRAQLQNGVQAESCSLLLFPAFNSVFFLPSEPTSSLQRSKPVRSTQIELFIFSLSMSQIYACKLNTLKGARHKPT